MWFFVCKAKGFRKPAVICLAFDSEGRLWVANIVPLADRSMGVRECNAVIESFYADLLEPCAKEAGVHVDFGEATVDLEDFMSSQAAKKLRQFSGAANKATGASHPMDLRRWNDFVIEAHKENAELSADELAEWLAEDGWGAEMASELAIRYEIGRSLLKAYDGR